MNDNHINFGATADLLGVNCVPFGKARQLLPEFPAGKRWRRQLWFSRPDVEAWMQGRDVPALIKAALSANRRELRVSISPFNALALRMLRGEFDPPERRARHDLKRLAARHCHKTPPIRVRVQADWHVDE